MSQEYTLTDQQGNVRITFDNSGTSGAAKVRQENSYYAFGLVMPGSVVTTPTNPNKHLYNGGSEWQNDFNNLPDYYQTLNRNYDAALGRWIGVDPSAEGAESMSTYQYAGNNPIMYNDPLGDLYKLPPPPFHFTNYGAFGTYTHHPALTTDWANTSYLVTGGGLGTYSGFWGALIDAGNNYLAQHSDEENINATWEGDNLHQAVAQYEHNQSNMSLAKPGDVYSTYSYWTQGPAPEGIGVVATLHTVHLRTPGNDDREANQGGIGFFPDPRPIKMDLTNPGFGYYYQGNLTNVNILGVHVGSPDKMVLSHIPVMSFIIPALDRFGIITSEQFVKNHIAIAINEGMMALIEQIESGRVWDTNGANTVIMQEINFQLRETFGSGAFVQQEGIPNAPSSNLQFSTFPHWHN